MIGLQGPIPISAGLYNGLSPILFILHPCWGGSGPHVKAALAGAAQGRGKVGEFA